LASFSDEALGHRRRQLWRDSATLLIGAVVALLAFQVLVPRGAGVPLSSPLDLPSGVAIGSVGPPATLRPDPTFGPIVDPSLGIDATPTPIPVITLPPKPKATPKASASPRSGP
jgi:hypothetical protein